MENTLIINAKVVTPLGTEAVKGFAMRRLKVVEDAAQAIGCEYRGRMKFLGKASTC